MTDDELLRGLGVEVGRSTEPGTVLRHIMEAHDALDPASDRAAQLRRVFIRRLTHDVPDALQEELGRFLTEHIQPSDFTGIEVEAPGQAAVLCELLYRFRYDMEDRAEQIQRHVDHLLKAVLQRFEQAGELEKMFKLLQIAPSHSHSDPELMRLRSRAHLYEMRRGLKLRRLLYGYMLLQALLVLVVFPVLFINAENGELQRRIEEATSVSLEDEAAPQTLSYLDGVYWSIITAASIGYGDITPRTVVGQMIAATLGTMGVLTVGVMAGLILFWITPRSLD